MVDIWTDGEGRHWADARRVHDEIWPDNNRSWWERGLAPPGEFLLVASIDGSVVGYLLGEYLEGSSIGHEVAVTPQFQGQNIGRRLILTWAEDAMVAGADDLLAKPLPGDTWERLDRFYRTIGFGAPEVDGHLQASPTDVVSALRP